MSPFLLWGLIGGSFLVAIYSSLAAKAKQPPLLNDALAILISSIATAGGLRICQYVVTGKLIATFKLAAACKPGALVLSEDDSIYFLFGGFALVRISVETIGRLLWTTFRAAFP